MTTELQYLYLTTTGRKSGLQREIEIWYTDLDGRFYIIAEKREKAGWVLNILHRPQISFRVGNQHFNGIGRIVDQVVERELWENVRALSDRKYGWSDGLIVELRPDPDIRATIPTVEDPTLRG
jgi:deazaflavin-dependent oxidoreductase (nitroreductase family)